MTTVWVALIETPYYRSVEVFSSRRICECYTESVKIKLINKGFSVISHKDSWDTGYCFELYSDINRTSVCKVNAYEKILYTKEVIK